MTTLIASTERGGRPPNLKARLAGWRAIRRGRAFLSASASRDGAIALKDAKICLQTALRCLSGGTVTRSQIEAMLLLAMVHDRLAERDAGIELLDASAALTRRALAWDLAKGPLRARLLNSLATSLVRRGERTGERTPLLEAIDIYRAALHDLRTKRDFTLRATLLAGLGTALVRVAEREADTTTASEAVVALTEALYTCSRRRKPQAWASIRNTLSTAQARLGERTHSSALLEEAAAGLRLALQERPRKTMPIGWAATMTDLGNVLVTLGDYSDDVSHYEEALCCFQVAIEEVPLMTSPRDFAETQMNIAALLQRRARRLADRHDLFAALHALDEAQRGVTRVECPLDWAVAQTSRAAILVDLGCLDCQNAPFEKALETVKAALAILSPEVAINAYEKALRLQEEIEAVLQHSCSILECHVKSVFGTASRVTNGHHEGASRVSAIALSTINCELSEELH